MTIMASVTSMPVQGTRIIQATSSLDQVLISDPVRRLFNQPNIVIHAIPRVDSPTAFRMVSSKPAESGVNGEPQLPDTPGDASQTQNSPKEKGPNEEENLLPSKNNGKSEILLVPITRKRKECGHFEPCESLICEVDVQEYLEDEDSTPQISVEIEEEEIDAEVHKHCKNKMCDALNIDNNRCRRVSIVLNRCDKSEICDVCKFKFKSRKAHANHKKCRRKIYYYHHNVATSTEVFKTRMRERELQILEASRTKKRIDYFDPEKGFKNTMDALTNNDELIIIPKMPPKTPTMTFPVYNSFSNNKCNNNNNNNCYNNSYNINNKFYKFGNKRIQSACMDKELTPEMIKKIIRSCQKKIYSDDKLKTSYKQIKLSEHLNGATVNIAEPPRVPNKERINFTVFNKIKKQYELQSRPRPQLPQLKKIGLPLKSVDFNLPQEQNPNAQSKKVVKNFNKDPQNPAKKHNTDVTGLSSNEKINSEIVEPIKSNNTSLPKKPVKTVTFADLKPESSLIHQTEGISKDTVLKSSLKITEKHILKNESILPEIKTHESTDIIDSKKEEIKPKSDEILNSSSIRPLQSVASDSVLVMKKLGGRFIKKQRKARKKMINKKYKCTICMKKFSSIDYCKLHIAKHENKFNFFCNLCEKGFSDKYLMKKHVDTDHKVGEMRCEMCNCVLPSVQALSTHMKSAESKIKPQCTECSQDFENCNSLDIHMRKEHGYLICIFCKRQIAKSMIHRHLMLEHCISQSRVENGVEKLTLPPNENDEVCKKDVLEILVKTEPPPKPAPKIETVIESKIEADCLAKGRSIRRRSSKEFFTCNVCERRFENEKQFQIHVANFPKKFTSCSICGKKFHRKNEFTEHSKTCNKNSEDSEQAPKRRKLNMPILKPILKSDKNNCIDQNFNDPDIARIISDDHKSEKTIKLKNSKDDKSLQTEEKKVAKVIVINNGDTSKIENSCELKKKDEKITHKEDKINKESEKGKISKVIKYNDIESKNRDNAQTKNLKSVDSKKNKKNEVMNPLKITAKCEIDSNELSLSSDDCSNVSNVKKDNAPKIEDKVDNTEEILITSKKNIIKPKNDLTLNSSSIIANIFQEHNYQSINKIEN